MQDHKIIYKQKQLEQMLQSSFTTSAARDDLQDKYFDNDSIDLSSLDQGVNSAQ